MYCVHYFARSFISMVYHWVVCSNWLTTETTAAWCILLRLVLSSREAPPLGFDWQLYLINVNRNPSPYATAFYEHKRSIINNVGLKRAHSMEEHISTISYDYYTNLRLSSSLYQIEIHEIYVATRWTERRYLKSFMFKRDSSSSLLTMKNHWNFKALSVVEYN